MIGFLPEERLINIPAAYRDQHELCFYLHDGMVTLLRGAEKVQASVLDISFSSPEELDIFMARDSPIDYFLEQGQVDVAKRIALNQVTPALFSDFLHFIYEALDCLERRKFVVAFALLRKPMQQNLLFASWMLADEDAFFDVFRKSPPDHMDECKFPSEKRIQIFDAALSRVAHYGLLDASMLNDVVYNKELPSGFAHLFAKANHLVTSRGRLARTEPLNLNFIFMNPNDDDVYESIYLSLSYLLFYALLVQIALFARMRMIEDSFTRWMTITAMGTFHALFVKGSSPLATVLGNALGKFMHCPHCKQPVSIRKRDTGRFFLVQRVHCRHCQNDFDFPLFWLLSQIDWDVTSSDPVKERAELKGRFWKTADRGNFDGQKM